MLYIGIVGRQALLRLGGVINTRWLHPVVTCRLVSYRLLVRLQDLALRPAASAATYAKKGSRQRWLVIGAGYAATRCCSPPYANA